MSITIRTSYTFAKHQFEACLDAFEPFVGLGYQTAELEVFYLVTDERAWRASRGEITCMVFDPGNATLIGTLENAGR